MSQSAADALRVIIAAGVREVAINPNTALTAAEAGPVANAITAEVLPGVLHATNNERWFQSRVTWGAIVTIGTGVLGAVGVATDWLDADTAIAVGMGLGSAIGGVITLYGRWKARQPIGAAKR